MIIDLHMHEKTYSADSFLDIREMIAIGREMGLDGICITDHDSMGAKAYADWYSQKYDFPIFVGIEYYSLEGDIVAFGIEEYPAERIAAQAFLDLVNAQGGIAFAAHPFRNNGRGLGEHLKTVTGLAGIEVLNGSTDMEACLKAGRYAEELELQSVGSSDCHVPGKIGVCATYFPEPVRTVNELAAAFKKGGLKPVYHQNGKYHQYQNIYLPLEPRMIEYVYK